MNKKMLLEKLVDKIAKKEEKKEELDFLPKGNYKMKEEYDSEKLMIGKLEYISSEATDFGPMRV